MMFSIANFFKILNTIKVVLLLLVGFMVYRVHQSQQELSAKQELRYKSYLLADELRQSSDDLTRFARTYVVTGDPVYEKYYWNILAIRNGEMPRPAHYERIYWDLVAHTGEKPRSDERTAAIQVLMRELGFSEQEFAKLAEAQKNSDELVRTEEVAMNAVKGLYNDGNGKFIVKDKPDFELARRLMHDGNYHRFKGKIMQPIDTFLEMLDKRTLEEVKQYEEKAQTDILILTVFLSLAIIIIAASYWIIHLQIIRPLQKISDYSENMAMGDFDNRLNMRSAYEIHNLVKGINRVKNGMKAKADFVNEIGNGNLGSDFTPLGEKDAMGMALLKMRANLKEIAEQESRRRWATEGLTKFNEILRQNNTLSTLCSELITGLVKYLGANQGGIFLLREPEREEAYLELMACYAYDRKKYLTKKVYLAEGLLGQAFLEAETMYLTAIPQSYVHITSGLGEATPTSLLIVPLKSNKHIRGVIEIASFNYFGKHEIEFIEQLAEDITATVMSVQVNEQTRKLLSDSQQQEEELRSQEEELRQNMEEMSATQEENRRNEQMYLERIAQLEAQLEKMERHFDANGAEKK